MNTILSIRYPDLGASIPSLTWKSPREELDKAIEEARLAARSDNTPDRAAILDNGSIALLFRYGQDLGQNPREIEEAVDLSRMAVKALRPMARNEGLVLSHRCSILLSWSEVIDDLEGYDKILEEAYLHATRAMKLLAYDKVALSQAQSHICQIRLQQAFRDNKHETLDQVITDQKEIVKTKHPSPDLLAANYNRLGGMLWERHNRTGSRQDLDDAIAAHYRAAGLIKELDDADLLPTHLNLGRVLMRHYQVTGAYQSLDAAIAQIAIPIKAYIPGRTSKDTPRDHAMALHEQAIALQAKCQHFLRTDLSVATNALDSAIQSGRDALKHLDCEDVRYFPVLTSIATWYGTKASITKNSSWGDESLKLLEQGLNPESKSLDYAALRACMAHVLEAQFQALKQDYPGDALKKLKEAVRCGREAVESSKPGHVLLGERRLNLGKMLLSKMKHKGKREHPDEARETLILAAKTENAPLVIRIPAALQGSLSLFRVKEYHEAHELIQGAIGLLSTNSLMALSSSDLRVLMRHLSGLGSLASSIALLDGQSEFEALRPLETARCVISELAMRGNTDLSELQIARPDMANEYTETNSRLRQTINQLQGTEQLKLSPVPSASSQSLQELQQTLIRSIQAQEEKIRALEGFEGFQLPLTESEMKNLASDGPIITVNVSMISSDAFVVTENGIEWIPLPKMEYDTLQKKLEVFSRHGNVARTAIPRIPEHQRSGNTCETLSGALRWLWDTAVGPILEKTPLKETKRVWWITCGLAGRAPLHAAGNHSPGSNDNTVSRVKSSYISSFKALRHARVQQKRSLPQPTSPVATVRAKRNMLLVTVSHNPPYHDLDTSGEKEVIESVFGNHESPTVPVDFTHLREPSPASVLRQLPNHAFVHFACHGASIDRDPSQSGLILVGKDDQEQTIPAMLTIARLEEVFMENPLQVTAGAGALAYLSACSTAEQTSSGLPDEAIHLANSLQAIGFRHVIGTMWGADDEAAGDIARRFYEGLLEDEEKRRTDGIHGTGGGEDKGIDAAGALHRAVTGYSADMMGSESKRLLWCPFIHIGV
ncbi:hypothetical protein CDV31_011704 [Fusarium ambrosium]|uniref:CHAT domain-containing protein n=1 Tax=Fusarium ambrosium TaxID=131363 RepID=A0A428TFB6_9HYPO|nr:hypothetical protein CDV31_011704 [Fusarium ambrosium]